MARSSTLIFVKVFMILMTVGWVFAWLLRPTPFWTRSWKLAEESLESQTFGGIGADILVFVFPVIMVAVLSAIYLHLRLNDQKSPLAASKNMFSNPIIVCKSLGIMTTLEVLMASLFILFLVWTYTSHIYHDLDKNVLPPKFKHLKLWEFRVMRFAVRLGSLAEVCLALLLFPVLRGMALCHLLGLQFDKSVRYHIWLANSMLIFATLHGLGILFTWGVTHEIGAQVISWQKSGNIYLAGEITLAVGLAMMVSSLPIIRRKYFELFYYTHHIYAAFFIMYLLHVGDRRFYTAFAGVLLFSMDKLLRIIQSKLTVSLVSASILPCKAIELVIAKQPEMMFTPTSMIFVKMANISKFQWHPFSITSSSYLENDRISFIAKCQGQWTNSLYERITSFVDLNYSGDRQKHPSVAVEGPYGPPSNSYLRYDCLLLFAGGNGITPFLSLIQEIMSPAWNGSCSLIRLVYVMRSSEHLSMLRPISHQLLNFQHEQQVKLALHAYVTQETRPDSSIKELLAELSKVQTIVFDNKYPRSPVTCPKNLLWQGYMIGFCFAFFLVGLACFNLSLFRGKVHKKELTFPSYFYDLTLVSALIIALVSTSLVAMKLRSRNKKTDVRTLIMSEKDVLPSEEQGLPDDHIIHYGQRPNFEEIFSNIIQEVGGCKVGVVSCGPQSMQEAVASICKKKSSFCLEKNQEATFTFHALNFTL